MMEGECSYHTPIPASLLQLFTKGIGVRFPRWRAELILRYFFPTPVLSLTPESLVKKKGIMHDIS